MRKSIWVCVVLTLSGMTQASASVHYATTYLDLIRPHGHVRSQAVYMAAVNGCYAATGALNTEPDTPAFKACMLRRHWRFLNQKLVQDPAPRDVAHASPQYGGPGVTVTFGGGDDDGDATRRWNQQQEEDADFQAGMQDMQDGIDAGAAAQAAASAAAAVATEQALGQQ